MKSGLGSGKERSTLPFRVASALGDFAIYTLQWSGGIFVLSLLTFLATTQCWFDSCTRFEGIDATSQWPSTHDCFQPLAWDKT